MRIGTKSVLFGVHQFALHPWFVAWAWKRLYGFPVDPRLWVAFFVHDSGYLGKPNMDGDEGERHPEVGATIMRVFGREWHDLCLYHSRFYAKLHGKHFSKLCVADKLAIALTPAWLYLPLARLSGELDEYMATYMTRTVTGQDRISRGELPPTDAQDWKRRLDAYMVKWVEEHKDGRADTWTNREAAPSVGWVRE